MSTIQTAATMAFHLSLNVTRLDRSVEFYATLFGQPPAKHYPDYAKFELAEPPVVLSLIPMACPPGGALNHAGLRLTDSAALVDVQARLEAAGFATEREEGVACCYSRQTKFWVSDPDRTLWEIYVLHHDLDEHGATRSPSPMVMPILQSDDAPPGVVWAHVLTQPIPENIPQADRSVDEIRLEGTFNGSLSPQRLTPFLSEARRVLRPGGQIHIHGLVADQPMGDSRPRLPGPAALVERVPTVDECRQALEAAGLIDVRVVKLGECACFVHEGVNLRESRLSASEPLS